MILPDLAKDEKFVSQVDEFFKEFVFGFIFHDIEAAITGKANYLAALGLVAYTEFMGGLLLGNLEKSGLREKRFTGFLSRMGPEYGKVQKAAREMVRHGLVHSYFIKQDSVVKMTIGLDRGERCGIEVLEPGRTIVFIVERYFIDFRLACERYRTELVKQRDTKLLCAFRQAVGQQWYFKRVFDGAEQG